MQQKTESSNTTRPSVLIAGTATSSPFSSAYLHTDHFIHQCQSHNCRMKHGNYLQYRIVLLINLRQKIKAMKMQSRVRQINIKDLFKNWSECIVATSSVLKYRRIKSPKVLQVRSKANSTAKNDTILNS